VTSKELIAVVGISLRFELVRVFVHLSHIAASSKKRESRNHGSNCKTLHQDGLKEDTSSSQWLDGGCNRTSIEGR